MKPASNFRLWTTRAIGFTLIELLIVIAVISILAALAFPVAGVATRSRMKAKVRTELEQVVLAIQGYKEKIGQYPPDNPANHGTNPLYFELIGTKLVQNGTLYQTLDGSAQIANNAAAFGSAYGPGTPLEGFVNCARAGGEESRPALRFLSNLKSTQASDLPGVPGVKILTCSLPLTAGGGQYPNPFFYNSSNPTNNPRSYDLWVDVAIGGKTNRFCNWSRQPLVR